MRKVKNAKNSDCIKDIEAEVDKYKKKREERIRLSKIQTVSEGSGMLWNTEYYSSK